MVSHLAEIKEKELNLGSKVKLTSLLADVAELEDVSSRARWLGAQPGQ